MHPPQTHLANWKHENIFCIGNKSKTAISMMCFTKDGIKSRTKNLFWTNNFFIFFFLIKISS